MITLNVEEHNDICGGCSYSGTANFDGRTVKEVLEEIREFAKDERAYIGEGFGNPSKHFASYRITYVLKDVETNGLNEKYCILAIKELNIKEV